MSGLLRGPRTRDIVGNMKGVGSIYEARTFIEDTYGQGRLRQALRPQDADHSGRSPQRSPRAVL